MPVDFQERILNALIRAGVAILTGGGVWQIADGAWYGKWIFSGFHSSLPLRVLNGYLIPEDTYRLWNHQMLFRSLSEGFGLKIILGLLVLMALFAHIVFKQNLAEARKSISQYRLPIRIYLRYYFQLTLCMFIILFSLLLIVSDKFWLMSLFLLILVPITVYVIYYSRDALKGSFYERLAYVSLLLFFLIAVVSWPGVYGQRAFDLELRTVLSIEGPPSLELSQGECLGGTFLFDEQNNIFATVILSPTMVKINLFEGRGDFRASTRLASLRDMAQNLESCPSIQEEDVFDDLRQKLTEAEHQ